MAMHRGERGRDNMYREQTGYRGDDMYERRRDWGTGTDDRDRDYGGTLGHVDRPYGRERGAQYGTSGPFGGQRGKGPASYARSDERIREDVNEALTDDDYVDATHVEVQVKDGEVTLSGTVPDRRTKRFAEECVEDVGGVKDVINNLRIQEQRETSGNGGNRTHPESVSSSPDKDAETGGRRPRA